MNLLKTLRALGTIPAVSGAEEQMAHYLKKAMTPFCKEVLIDAVGNVLCRMSEKKDRETLLFSAHMDEIGFLVSGADENGFLQLAPLGGIRPETVAYSRVKFENGKIGLLVPKQDTKREDLDSSKFVCDIGSKNAAGALASVKIGDRCTTVSPLTQLNGRRISARALDNRLGVAVLLHTAQELSCVPDLPYNVSFAFTVQEEVGLRGAAPAAFALCPDYAVNVDITTADDAYGAKGPVKLGGGPTVKYKDRSVVCNRRMIDHLNACAKRENIPVQAEILVAGGTDTGPIQSSRAGVVSGAVSIPLRYVHTDCECAQLSDAENAVRLCVSAAKTKLS